MNCEKENSLRYGLNVPTITTDNIPQVWYIVINSIRYLACLITICQKAASRVILSLIITTIRIPNYNIQITGLNLCTLCGYLNSNRI